MDEGDGFENRGPQPSKSCTPNDIERTDAGGVPKKSALCERNPACAVLSGSLAPDLAQVVLAWPALPHESKAAILALVTAHEALARGGRQ